MIVMELDWLETVDQLDEAQQHQRYAAIYTM